MVGVRCHLSSLAFDTSKACDSHPIVMRKEWGGAAMLERTCRARLERESSGDCGVTGPGCFAST